MTRRIVAFAVSILLAPGIAHAADDVILPKTTPSPNKTRTIDVHVAILRRKLDLQDKISTVYKVGYRLEAES